MFWCLFYSNFLVAAVDYALPTLGHKFFPWLSILFNSTRHERVWYWLVNYTSLWTGKKFTSKQSKLIAFWRRLSPLPRQSQYFPGMFVYCPKRGIHGQISNLITRILTYNFHNIKRNGELLHIPATLSFNRMTEEKFPWTYTNENFYLFLGRIRKLW